MSVELFIARHIYRSREEGENISPPAIRVAVASMALGLAVMLLSVAVGVGFKKEVRNKVIGFGGHIQISAFDSNLSYEMRPIAVSDSLLNALQNFPNIAKVEKFAMKLGIIKTNEESFEALFKGIDENRDWTFIGSQLKEGRLPAVKADSTSTEVLISQYIADKLLLKTGDSFLSYFLSGNDVRARKFTISGIYQTNFQEYDKQLIFADINQIRRLNGWDEDMVGGLELTLKNFDYLDATTDALYFDLQSTADRLGNVMFTRSVTQMNPMIFDWLSVLDTNVWVILALMLLVAGFSMISGLMIIILERANMIGILKAMGQDNSSIRKIFLYVSGFIIVRGLVWGNVIGLGICVLQRTTGLFRMNPEIYYLKEVPVDINVWAILALNVGTLVITLLMLIIPSYLVSKISPAKTIRFE